MVGGDSTPGRIVGLAQLLVPAEWIGKVVMMIGRDSRTPEFGYCLETTDGSSHKCILSLEYRQNNESELCREVCLDCSWSKLEED